MASQLTELSSWDRPGVIIRGLSWGIFVEKFLE